MSAVQALPFDQTLPQLQVALDPLMMQLIFQNLLVTDNAAIHVDSCIVERVKYKAGEKCVISYLLHLYDGANDCCHEQRLATRLFPAGLSAARYQKALCEPVTPPRYGKAVTHLPELGMVLWAFPNDRKIATLPHLMATARQENDELATIVQKLWGETYQIVQHHHRLVHYVPEHTCTVCVELQVAPPPVLPAALPTKLTLFGKAYYNDDGAETYRLMTLLWAKPRCSLRIAQPLAYDPQTRILWQKGLLGQTLSRYPLGSPAFAIFLTEAAQTVASLHGATLPCTRQSHLAEWTAQLQNIQQMLKTVHPASQNAVAVLVTALLRQAPIGRLEPSATLHGDLHLQNFLVDESAPAGQRVALIDLDNLSTGSPWCDLGSFCAGLYYRGLVEGVPQALIQHAIDTFCAAYAQVAPWPLEPQAIGWYTATALLNERAFRTISRMKQGRFDLLDDLIRLASALHGAPAAAFA